MLIKDLSNISGVSGDEKAVRDFIKSSLKSKNLKIETDSMGNLLVYKKGKVSSSVPRLMLCAHMDEVGLMVTSIEKSGHLRFKKVGGIDDRVLVAKAVLIGDEKIPGIIGAKAIHLQRPEERKKPFEVDTLLIDIGAKNNKDAAKIVKVGDYASFDTKCISIGDNYLMGKAFDDRAGCAALIELLNTDDLPSFCGAFTVQEEVGLRGARVASYTVKPDLALVLEGTSAADVPDKDEHLEATSLGSGPALSFMDSSVIVNRELLENLILCAEDNNIPYQLRRFTGGGTEAGSIQASRSGVKTAVISVPTRYIHSPASVIKESDYNQLIELAGNFLEEKNIKKLRNLL